MAEGGQSCVKSVHGVGVGGGNACRGKLFFLAHNARSGKSNEIFWQDVQDGQKNAEGFGDSHWQNSLPKCFRGSSKGGRQTYSKGPVVVAVL